MTLRSNIIQMHCKCCSISDSQQKKLIEGAGTISRTIYMPDSCHRCHWHGNPCIIAACTGTVGYIKLEKLFLYSKKSLCVALLKRQSFINKMLKLNTPQLVHEGKPWNSHLLWVLKLDLISTLIIIILYAMWCLIRLCYTRIQLYQSTSDGNILMH